MTQAIFKIRKQLETEEKNLKTKADAADRQKKYRTKHRSSLKRVVSECPGASDILHVRPAAGQPRIETDQPGLLETICDIASFGGSADERRRSQVMRSCRTLSQLRDELVARGFQLSRSATYIRLIPRNVTTLEGKRHVVTVPVRLRRAQNDLHRSHDDQHFCRATINSLESLASALSPYQVSLKK